MTGSIILNNLSLPFNKKYLTTLHSSKQSDLLEKMRTYTLI
jgi:hypothetical protein